MDSLHRAINRGIQRYLYDPEPCNDIPHEAIACLGQIYHSAAPVPSSSNESGHTERAQAVPWPREFLDDVEAKLWFTYRTGFPKISKAIGQAQQPGGVQRKSTSLLQDGFTADTGFGCMMRSAQTLLANALLVVHMSRNWRRGDDDAGESSILRLFADDMRAPFSIHRFMERGAAACDKPAGQWFGPQAASQCIKALSERFEGSDLAVYLADEQGGAIYADEVLKLAQSPSADPESDFDILPDPNPSFKPVLILIPSRLGHDKINPRYHATLLSLFALNQFAGIAGGRPSSAHYFFAKQGESVFFLDPHFPRPALPYLANPSDTYSQDERDSTHTRRIRRMALSDIDPSMLIGFLIRDMAGWQHFRQQIQAASIVGKESRALHICCVVDSRPQLSPSGSESRSIMSPPGLRGKFTSNSQVRNGSHAATGKAQFHQQAYVESNRSNRSAEYDFSSKDVIVTPGTSMESGEMVGMPEEDDFGVVSENDPSIAATSDDDAVDLGDVTVGTEQNDLLSDEEGPQ
jgi:cysteine protease ATG4